MDDPGLAWPAWKFGMKRDAIYTTLHDRYNTFQSTIQDPDAFQHDVHEIASEAASTAEFHHLLGQRRELRLNELNDSLESASYEIIANPMLVGTKQWEHALQLFRTRSLDSLVRYFASYLPSDHQWYQPKSAHLHDVDVDADGLPPSPRSITTYSDDMETSAHDLGSLSSLNTMSSYTDSDSEAGDDEHEQRQSGGKVEKKIENKNENKNENEKAVDSKTTVNNVKNTDAVTFDDDDCSSQSSGPDTPDSMSDAEPDVDVTDDDAHDDAHAHGHMDRHVQQFKALAPKVPADTTVQITEAQADSQHADKLENKQNQPTPTRRSPLQSGFAADATRCSSPMPSPLPLSLSQLLPVSAALRSRQRSISPSRPFPLVCAHAVDQTDDSDCNTHAQARGVGRLSRSRLALVQSQRLASPSRSSRRRPGVGAGVGGSTKIEKTPTPLPRPMRTRLRERREAAAATIQRN